MQFHTHLHVHYMDFICHNRPEGSAYTAGTRAYHADRVYRAASEPHATCMYTSGLPKRSPRGDPLLGTLTQGKDLHRTSISSNRLRPHDRKQRMQRQ